MTCGEVVYGGVASGTVGCGNVRKIIMCGGSQEVKGGRLKICSRSSSRVRFPFSALLIINIMRMIMIRKQV